MKNKILEEIKKINFYSNYRPEKTLTENLLLESGIGILDNILTKVGAKNFSKLTLRTVEDMVVSFKTKFGDDVMSKLVAKQGKDGADDIVEKLYKGENLSSKQAAEFVEAAADFVIGGQTVREIVSESFEGSKIKTMMDGMDDAGKLQLRDTSPTFMYFTDDFLDATLGLGIKKIRQTIKAADDALKKATDDATIKANKEAAEKLEAERLLKRNKLQVLVDDFKGWMSKPWNKKGLLKKGLNISLDLYVLKMGLGAVFAIFGGPIWSVFASLLVAAVSTVVSRFLVPQWLKKLFKKMIKGTGDVAADYSGKAGAKSTSFVKNYFSRYLLGRKGMSAAKTFYLSKGFWWTLTLFGYLMVFLDGKYGQLLDSLFGGKFGEDISGAAELMKNGNWNDMVIMSSLTGKLYQDFYDAPPVGNLQEFGVEFDETVLDSSADGLIDTLLIYKRWVGITLPNPLGDDIKIGEEIDFLAGYEIDSEMVRQAQESVLEFFKNSPSLLFIAAVSNRVKEKTKGTTEGEHDIMKLLDEYHASKDKYLIDIIGGEAGAYNIDFSEIKTLLRGKPLFTEEMDEFIEELYDSVLKGEPLGQMKDLVEREELNCEQKEQMMQNTFAPTISGMNDLFDELGYENGMNFTYDCNEDSISFNLSRELDRAKIFKKLAKTLPFEGALYTNNDGLIATKQTKNRNEAWIELDGNFELIDIVGSQMSIDEDALEDSSQKGMMFYALAKNKKMWCPALIEYFTKFPGVDTESDIFVGGKCTTKIFKQMPILKTLAAAQLTGFGNEIYWSGLDNTFIEELQKVKPDDEPSDIGKDMMNIEESRTIGLGRILIESRKNNINGRTR